MKEYLSYTRAPWYSFLFSLPLLLLYQLAALLANVGERRAVINGADALVQGVLNLVGLQGWLATALAVAAIFGVLAYRADPAHRKGTLRRAYFPLLLAESTAYALVFGTVVAVLTALVLPGAGFLQIGGGGMHLGQKLAVSLGAGLYEELVFRLLLTGGFIGLFRHFRWSEGQTAAAAVLASSLIFSAFHYLPGGDMFTLTSVTFRFIAGVVLAGLYAARGFAVAAWTHALYDVFLVLAGRA